MISQVILKSRIASYASGAGRRRLGSFTAGVLALSLLAGCNPVKQDRLSDRLQNATNGYQTALRWGYFENAYGYLHPDQRDKTPMPDTLTGLRLTGYDVIQSPVMDTEAETATQIVAIDYLYEDRQVVKQLKDRQRWRYDAEKNTWWLESGLPAFER
ncbi:hypothetical protein [Allochromatium palmeri]|uniref:Uncharacterized protein n=1 Tax=Allochromatium palmeri TaxID=231048 RepID=A0A6N8EJ33_9GAMM|nr:hypothetical protein [Allochromatium palmeri]MTW22334.1 hypothetical protein [Allochromatium palmeri]